MHETVLITGATGLVGRHLSALLKEKGYRVLTLVRNPEGEGSFCWDPENAYIDAEALNQTDHIVHLAGASIGDKRWSDDRKVEILSSRVKSCELLFQKCQENGVHLKSFITASAVGFYGDGGSFTEKDPAGQGFLASVCQKWEKAADLFQESGVRTVKIRTGIVMAAEGGILSQMAMPVRMGLGTPLGNGKQAIPWIHIQDLCRIYLQALQQKSWSGAYNAVAPEVMTNRKFTKTLAAFFHKPYWPIPIPGFLFRLMLGERSELLLNGSQVGTTRLAESVFLFKFPELKSALSNLYP
jgi:uncharacterized protein